MPGARGYAPVGTEETDGALQDGVALRLLAKYCPTLMDDEDQQLMMDDATTVVSEASVPATTLSEPLDDEPLFDDDSDEDAAPKERPRLFASVPSARVPMLRRPPTCVCRPRTLTLRRHCARVCRRAIAAIATWASSSHSPRTSPRAPSSSR